MVKMEFVSIIINIYKYLYGAALMLAKILFLFHL